MNTYDFKNDLAGSVFRLMGRLIKPFTLFMVIYLVVISLFSSLLLPSSIGDFATELMADLQKNSGDSMAGVKMNAAIASYFMDNLFVMGTLTLVLFLIGMVSYNYYFNVAQEEVQHENNNFKSGFNNLLDSRVGHYFLVYIILTVIYQGLNYLLQSVISNQTLLMLVSFLFSLTVGGVYGWFHLAYSKVGLGNSSFLEAFKFASSKMTFVRVAKTVGIFILFSIGAGIAFSILGGIAFVFAQFIPYAGAIIGLILVAFALALMVAFGIAGAAGLYYRYTDDQDQEEQFVVTD